VHVSVPQTSLADHSNFFRPDGYPVLLARRRRFGARLDSRTYASSIDLITIESNGINF
jgi:hypothetical protein